jgi:hypothetical protein
MWENGVDSGVNRSYVSNLYPKRGEEITLSIQVPDESPVLQVLLVTFSADRQENHPCVKNGNRYAATVCVSHPEGIWWHFRAVYIRQLSVRFGEGRAHGLCRSFGTASS